MKIRISPKGRIHILIFSLVLFGMLIGFSLTDEKPENNIFNELTGRIKHHKPLNENPSKFLNKFKLNDPNTDGNQRFVYGSPYYTDNFDGMNDTNSLLARGYKVYYRGTGLQNTSVPVWFQGNPIIFSSFNGPANGYVGGIYQVVTGANNIDNWLVLPPNDVSLNDSIHFYQRTQFDPSYPDSVRVMYSAAGDSVPEALSWVELGRFRANYSTDNWKKVSYKAAASGINARFAIRYSVVNSGPSGVNGNFIGIDALSLEKPDFINDAGLISVNSPAGTIGLPSSSVIPSVTVKNFGTAVQTFNVTMSISPGGYSSTKTITSLSGNSTQNLNFDNYIPLTGNYSVKVFSELLNDENNFNDTIYSSFIVMQPNYGGGNITDGGYFFANSTVNAASAPSQPVYSRADTSGSTTLVSNNIAVVPLSKGNLDDGHWALSGLGGSRKIKFMGNSYDSVFIGTNGIICFTNFVPDQSNWSPPVNGLPGDGAGGICRPGIYPFWNDINFANTEQPDNRLSYKVDTNRNILIISYDKAPVFNGTSSDFETFQILIEFQEELMSAPNSNIVFSYDNASTTMNIPLLIGLQNASGSEFLQYTFINSGSAIVTPGPIYDSASAGVSVSFGPDANRLLGNYKTLNLTVLPQGFWNGVTNIPDTLSVQIRQINSPYNIVEISNGNTDASGNVIVNFANAASGTAYYLVVKHRNSLETWSESNGITWTGSKFTSYDFTDSDTKAFGNNLVLTSGKYCLWGGDVNQDGIVDAGDISGVENENGTLGYTSFDVNGDDFVDASDLSFTENNSDISPFTVHP